MTRAQQPALVLFAVGLIGLGILALIYGDFALVWQPVAAWIPGRTALAYGSGGLMLAVGVGLFFEVSAAWAVRILLPYLIVWALLKVPALVVAPKIEGVWLGEGELTMLLAGGWILFARFAALSQDSRLAFLTGEKAVRAACMLFGISLVPVGLSHLVYVQITAGYVPAWLPARTFWAYLTGAGQMACGLGLLFSVLPRVAAVAEACMLSLFTLLVWGPAIVAAPTTRLPWTAFFISWIIAAAGWTVAVNSRAGKHNLAAE
ncbi:MAG TPA: DoxX family protein [Terracidiphilus sp.]|nr:DoxX family protein [Terracidiphilus sp.]